LSQLAGGLIAGLPLRATKQGRYATRRRGCLDRDDRMANKDHADRILERLQYRPDSTRQYFTV